MKNIAVVSFTKIGRFNFKFIFSVSFLVLWTINFTSEATKSYLMFNSTTQKTVFIIYSTLNIQKYTI